MKFVLDTHCHTIASGHAYSTVHDLAREAKNVGLKMFALTDHGPAMPGGPHIYHIENQKVIPRVIDGVFVLRGVEANIMDYDGNLDLPDKSLENLDLVLASLHDICIKPGNAEENTKAIIGAIENKYVDIIGHPGNPAFEIDAQKVLKAAKENNVLIEINNSSFGKSRPGSKENCIKIAKMAKEMKVNMIAGTDSHIAFQLGKFEHVKEIFKDIYMPEDLIMNTCLDKFISYLEKKGKKNINDFRILLED